MALNNISSDILPPLESTDDEQRDEESSAHSLPHLAWDRIAHYVSDDTATLMTLATFSQDLKDICRPYISMHYEVLRRDERFLYHRVLQLVMQGYVDPSYIYEVECKNAKLDRGGVKRGKESMEDLKYRYDAIRPADQADVQARLMSRLLREAVRKSPWIPQAREAEICEQFHIGDPDIALAVLLPLCTKIKTLEIPQRANYCAAVVQAVARRYHQRGITGEEARRSAWQAALRDRDTCVIRRRPEPDALPFSELMVLYTQDVGFSMYTICFAEMIAFMGIPSLHRVVLVAVRDSEFRRWPTGLVESCCPEIWLHRSLCTSQAVLALARGMAGPCEIRQHYELDPSYVQSGQEWELTWDSVLVRCREDGSTDIQARIAFEGGDPGYEHAWVSWMFWGKMQDWRRLDEEFSVQEGDDKIPEMGAGF